MTQPSEKNESRNTRIRVWDIPVRLFHWILASSFFIAWFTLDNRYLDIHIFAGYLMAGLIVFRILWGFIGGPYARFHDFAFGYSKVWNYLKDVLNKCPPRFLGHNPVGSWAIYLLLVLGLSIAITGLLALGGEERQGPLAGLLNYPQGRFFHEFHEWLSWMMLGLVIIHVAGVLIESWLHRENLVMAMFTGFKSSSVNSIATVSHWKTGATMLVAIVTAGLFWFQGYLIDTPEKPYQPFLGPVLPDNLIWRAECGDCHLAFHPSLLPVRSWKAMMQEQATHFEEDLSLDQDVAEEIENFLVENAADQGLTEVAWKINRSIPESEILLRITEAPYWVKKHQAISVAVWDNPKVNGKFDCAACHLDAEAGTFEDAAMHLPAVEQPSINGIKEE